MFAIYQGFSSLFSDIKLGKCKERGNSGSLILTFHRHLQSGGGGGGGGGGSTPNYINLLLRFGLKL